MRIEPNDSEKAPQQIVVISARVNNLAFAVFHALQNQLNKARVFGFPTAAAPQLQPSMISPFKMIVSPWRVRASN